MLRYLVSALLLLQLCHADFLGLNPYEKKIVSKTWALFKKDPKVGEAILLEALKAHPDARKQFKMFADIPIDKLKEEVTFQDQGNKTLAAVTRVVTDMDDEDKVASFLRDIGQMHKRRKVPTEDFKKFHVAVVNVMKSRLGYKLSPYAEAAVAKLMKNMIQRIIQEYNDELLH
ncbi:globin CTT-VI-like [Periplaneta americana]|uniref:globin CTT-VI-like n=1 Tax=Periplaneta americana TaxID=6978 RepID=UPI0037E7CBFC